MTPLYGHSEAVADFVSKLIPRCGGGFGECSAIGVIDESGKLIGGLVFNNWEPEFGTIEVTGAATDRRWFTRDILDAVDRYAFGDLGCQMLIARHSANARHIRRLWLAVGAEEFVIPRLWGRNEDGVISTITQESWNESRFKRHTHGQPKTTETA